MKDIRAVSRIRRHPSHVLQDVLARLDKAYQAFFRRVRRAEGGLSAISGDATATTASPTRSSATARRLDNGFLVLSKIGRIAVRWSRPFEGTPKTVTISREADGWYVCFSCADVPTHPLPPTGQETGIDLGIEAFATLSDGTRIFSSWLVSQSRTRAENCPTACEPPQEGQQPQAQGGHAARQGASDRCAASGRTFTTRRRWRSYEPMTRSITRTCRRPTWSRTTTSPRASAMRGGARS